MAIISTMRPAVAPNYAVIVDDDPATLDVYDLTLSYLGFTPVLVSDSDRAVEKILSCKPAVVLLDQRLRGHTGIKLIGQLRAKGLTDVPIILVTASRGLGPEALTAGASACVEKPFEVSELIDVIQRHTTEISAA